MNVDLLSRHPDRRADFETALDEAINSLRAGAPIEECLGDTPEPERAALLRELIGLDVAYRRGRG